MTASFISALQRSWFEFRSSLAADPPEVAEGRSAAPEVPQVVAEVVADLRPDELKPTQEVGRTTERVAARVLIRWSRNPHLQVLKMLAYTVFVAEGVRNADRLEERVASLFPAVVEAVTGEQGVTYEAVQVQTLAEQGALITASKLLQRADRTDRYLELNDYWEQVDAAYAGLV
jgi:hypothetical protein